MNVGIVGSKSRKDHEIVETLISGLPEGTVVVSRGGQKLDKVAIQLAKEKGFGTMEMYPYVPPSDTPEWTLKRLNDSHIKRFVENTDVIYAFVDENREDDMDDLIRIAERMRIPVEIVEPE